MIIRLTFVERVLHRLHLLPTPVMDAFASVVFGRALTIAVRRGLFEALSSAPHTTTELAVTTNLDRKALELLLESFVAAGYLKTRNGEYLLTAGSRRWLLKDSPSYIGNLIRYFETLYGRWINLEHSLEHGQPPQPYFDGWTDNDWKVYLHGMQDLARLLLPQVMKRVILPSLPHHLLDLGGSHGLYAIACCRRYPTLTATIIDFDEALRHTHTIVAEAAMSGRVQLLPADFTQMEFPPSQDCILMFNIIHGFREDVNRGFIRRALKALKPRGKIYILDQIREERRKAAIAQFMPLMVGLNLLNEIGGSTYSYEHVKEWTTGAAKVKRMRLLLPGVSLVEVTR